MVEEPMRNVTALQLLQPGNNVPNDSPDQVSKEFLAAARRQGLSNPLTGLNDGRLKNLESLSEDNWVKHSFPEEGIVIYRYEVGEKTVQYYGRRDTGHEVIGTFRRQGNTGEVEHIVKTPDGKVSRIRSPEEYVEPVRLCKKAFATR